MTTSTTTPAPSTRTTVAHIATEALAPAIMAALLPTVVTADQITWHRPHTILYGAGWLLIALIFGAAVPYGFIVRGVRRGQLTDRHVGRREQRWIPLVVAAASVAIGLTLLLTTNAPRPLLAAFVLMLLTIAVLAVVNRRWKLSAHTTVSTATGVFIAFTVTPFAVAALPLVALVGWSRVHLKAHTITQVCAGAAVGAALATIIAVTVA